MAYSCLAKIAIIVELTVCFETNFQDTKERKVAKYSELVEEIEENDFVVGMITLKVGSRGFVASVNSETQLEPHRGSSTNYCILYLWQPSRDHSYVS